MGQILSNPVIDKEQESGGDALTAFGLCAMQGWRMSMEDSHIVDLNIAKDASEHLAYYCVFDGHGGSSVAQFCGSQFSKILQKQESFKKHAYKQALLECFIAADEELLKDPVLANDHSGCTATTLLISKLQNVMICANSGDSRTVLSKDHIAKALSYDHKPTLKSEYSRIVAADGFVEMDRVNGNLALSRAIGDFEFKSNPELSPHEQIVTCVPDLIEHSIDYDQDEFVILACDGIWDCLTSQDCVNMVHWGLKKGLTLEEISSKIIDVCCSPTTEGTGIGCDNMSIIIVALLKPGEDEAAWSKRILSKNFEPPISFENQRRAVFHFYDFPKNDDHVFEVTNRRESDDLDDNNERKGGAQGRGASSLANLEAILGSGGIQITPGENNLSYIHGTALSEVLASLSGGIRSQIEEDEEDQEGQEENADDSQQQQGKPKKN